MHYKRMKHCWRTWATSFVYEFFWRSGPESFRWQNHFLQRRRLFWWFGPQALTTDYKKRRGRRRWKVQGCSRLWVVDVANYVSVIVVSGIVVWIRIRFVDSWKFCRRQSSKRFPFRWIFLAARFRVSNRLRWTTFSVINLHLVYVIFADL